MSKETTFDFSRFGCHEQAVRDCFAALGDMLIDAGWPITGREIKEFAAAKEPEGRLAMPGDEVVGRNSGVTKLVVSRDEANKHKIPLHSCIPLWRGKYTWDPPGALKHKDGTPVSGYGG